MKKWIQIIILLTASAFAKGQDISSLPVTAYPAKSIDPQKPLIIYLSGDGGENSFSKSLMQEIRNRGFSVVLFNSLKYFWSKKSPEQAAADISKVIQSYRSQWKLNKVILIGYSFGADVAPFVMTRFTRETSAAIRNIVLMSPSSTTDFEVHVSGLFGKSRNAGTSVASEINKITQKPLLIIQGEDEKETIDPAAVKVPHKLVILKGGHRYESTTDVANTIFKNI